MKLKIKMSRHFGFTLVELLVVIAISGILASASYIGIQEVRKTIRDNKRRADLNEVARALELFKADQGQYPPNNYLSVNVWNSPTNSGDYLMSFLKTGGTLSLGYKAPGGGFTHKTVTFAGGYLQDNVQDPLNITDSADIYDDERGYAYAYYGPGYIMMGNLSGAMLDIPNQFPMDCPEPPGGQCGTPGSHESTWGECCGLGDCLDRVCDFYDNGTVDQSDDAVSWFNFSSNFARYCYGTNSQRSMGLLLARLDKPSKPEERINEVFSFCPTAAVPGSDDYLNLFNYLKRFFPRGKDCYNGNDTADWICDDNGETNWNGWALSYYNYFVPLTGEFNLR